MKRALSALAVCATLGGCGGGGDTVSTLPSAATPGGTASAAPATSPTPPAPPTPLPVSAPTPPSASAQLHLPAGFAATVIAHVDGARELAALPNGDLLVGTSGSTIAIVPQAEAAGVAAAAATFATLSDDRAAGLAYGPDGNVYVGTDHSIWRIAYTSGAVTAGTITQLGAVRSGAVSPHSDGDNHVTTSVAVSGSTLFAGVGSDCDACTEVDPTRASIKQVPTSGGSVTTKAKNERNALALAVDPATGAVWVGGAGQDSLPAGHPYETLDAVTSHPGVVDYGWPVCYDNRTPVDGTPAAACAGMTTAALIFPAYATLVGAAFYPSAPSGAYAFPAAYRGGLFVTMHGSWHTSSGDLSAVQPQVVFVPFAAGAPSNPVNWNDPTTQWQSFFNNFGTTVASRIGRPTGVAVGPQGSLFVADDLAGNVYRIRPLAAATQSIRRR